MALAQLLLADARLPSGGHTHSAGLEPAVFAGLGPGEVAGLVRSRLFTAGLVDAATAVVARRVLVDEVAFDLADVDRAAAARTPSPAQRTAARALGRGLARVLARLAPEHPAVAALGSLEAPLRGVAFGAAAAVWGLGAVEIAEVCCYDEVQTIAAATLKLLPTDPLTVTGWVLASAPDVAAVVARAADCAVPDDIPAATAPLAEHWAETHATRTRRLFSA